jgi:alpha-galactosidase
MSSVAEIPAQPPLHGPIEHVDEPLVLVPKEGAFHRYTLGDMVVEYRVCPVKGVRMVFWPSERTGALVPRREHLETPEVMALPEAWRPLSAYTSDSLVHVKIRGEGETGGRGRSMRNSPSTQSLEWRGQQVRRDTDGVRVVTRLRSRAGWAVDHILEWATGTRAARVTTELRNTTCRPITVEHLSSVSLGGLSPFAADGASGRLHLHRFRSAWAAEARHQRIPLERLHMESAWAPFGPRVERIAQAGSLPVNGFFPWLGMEDEEVRVWWAIQLEAPASWQLEAYRRGDEVHLSGGLADRDTGQWWKTLAPGETFTAPSAWVSTSSESLDDLCDRLLQARERNEAPGSAHDLDLPVIYNEFCTTWGNPTERSLLAAAPMLAELKVGYAVVDDGWAKRPATAKLQSNGDWLVDEARFPRGLVVPFAALKARGIRPGLWFEFECVNPGAEAWEKGQEHMLRLHGEILKVGNRRFWDFRDPRTISYLRERMIGLLRASGADYLKVDYNESTGASCDGAESPGEALRQHVAGVLDFFRLVRRELPGLVIENCASGGHRLEPAFLAVCDMASFSDAHESPELPLIAGSLARLVPAHKLQIWSVLRPGQTQERTAYSLAATFWGRICLSGDLDALEPRQLELVRDALDFYRSIRPLIRDAAATLDAPTEMAWRAPLGRQIVRRLARDGRKACVVSHVFGAPEGRRLAPLPPGRWTIDRVFPPHAEVKVGAEGVWLPASRAFTAVAVALSRTDDVGV